MDDIKLNYDRPFFEDQVMPKGELSLDMRAHACWYYAMLATKNMMRVGRGAEDQIITYDALNNERAVYEQKRYEEIAISVGIIYGYSPDEFLAFEDMVRKEGRRLLGIEFADEIFQPKKNRIN